MDRFHVVRDIETGVETRTPFTPSEDAAADAQDALAAKAAIPTTVTPYQARVALLNAGLLDSVNSLIANPATPKTAVIAWEYATAIDRASPFIEALGPSLNLADAQIDALFVAAAAVV